MVVLIYFYPFVHLKVNTYFLKRYVFLEIYFLMINNFLSFHFLNVILFSTSEYFLRTILMYMSILQWFNFQPGVDYIYLYKYLK